MLEIENVLTRLSLACIALGSQKNFAKKHGVSAAYVNDVLSYRREPGKKILRALNLKKVVGYVRMSLLLPVLTILLSVGVAQAGDTCRVVEKNGCLVSDCGAFTGNCAGFNYMPAREMDVYLKERNGCYQKMQEAMKAMDKVMRENFGGVYLRKSFWEDYPIHDGYRAQWNSAIQECVK